MTSVPLCEVWICEGCGEIHTGVNPPDVCLTSLPERFGAEPGACCLGEMFENGLDVAREGRVFTTELN